MMMRNNDKTKTDRLIVDDCSSVDGKGENTQNIVLVHLRLSK